MGLIFCLEMCIVDLLSLDNLNFSNLISIPSFLLSVIYLLVIIFLFLFVPIYLFWNYKKMTTLKIHFKGSFDKFHSQFSPLFGDYKADRASIIYSLIFILWRILYAGTIVFLKFSAIAQCISFLVLTVPVFLYQIKFRPYKSRLVNFTMTINELALVIDSVFFFFFLGEQGDREFYMGYAMIALLVLVISLNFLITVTSFAVAICIKFYKLLRQTWKAIATWKAKELIY